MLKTLDDLMDWDAMFKMMIWQQLGDIKGKRILDFGSGEGITASFLAKDNEVVAVEPWDEQLKNRWQNYPYTQIQGDISAVKEMDAESFDMIICHNVLEYIDDKAIIIKELSRVLKKGGTLSIAKHNRNGRIMQMAVLLDDMDKAHDLLDGKDSCASKFGAIRYYEDEDICKWCPDLSITKVLGLRTFWDLQQNQEKHKEKEWKEKMVALEMRVSDIPEFVNIAFFHHVLLNK